MKDADINALWIVEPPTFWHGLPSLPQNTSIVMSFKISATSISVGKDFAFFLANHMRVLFCDGAEQVCIVGISFVVDIFSTVGFIASSNVTDTWFDIISSSLWYDQVPNCPRAYYATWPLNDKWLGYEEYIDVTLNSSR